VMDHSHGEHGVETVVTKRQGQVITEQHLQASRNVMLRLQQERWTSWRWCAVVTLCDRSYSVCFGTKQQRHVGGLQCIRKLSCKNIFLKNCATGVTHSNISPVSI
jgi:hypothetical protein